MRTILFCPFWIKFDLKLDVLPLSNWKTNEKVCCWPVTWFQEPEPQKFHLFFLGSTKVRHLFLSHFEASTFHFLTIREYNRELNNKDNTYFTGTTILKSTLWRILFNYIMFFTISYLQWFSYENWRFLKTVKRYMITYSKTVLVLVQFHFIFTWLAVILDRIRVKAGVVPVK